MVAHIYPSVLQALAGRGRTERLEGEIAGDRGEAMQDLGYELPRIPIPRTPVNKGKGVRLPEKIHRRFIALATLPIAKIRRSEGARRHDR
jgi:hypothetical protein